MRRWVPFLILLTPLAALMPFVLIQDHHGPGYQATTEHAPVTDPATWPARYAEGKVAYEAEDYETAIERLLPIAVDGYPPAQRLFGLMLDEGAGMPADQCLSAIWFDKAARGGDAEAQYLLGAYYHGLSPMRENLRLSYYWVMVAAKNGYPNAKPMLGFFDAIRRDERTIHLVQELDDRMVAMVAPEDMPPIVLFPYTFYMLPGPSYPAVMGTMRFNYDLASCTVFRP